MFVQFPIYSRLIIPRQFFFFSIIFLCLLSRGMIFWFFESLRDWNLFEFTYWNCLLLLIEIVVLYDFLSAFFFLVNEVESIQKLYTQLLKSFRVKVGAISSLDWRNDPSLKFVIHQGREGGYRDIRERVERKRRHGSFARIIGYIRL